MAPPLKKPLRDVTLGELWSELKRLAADAARGEDILETMHGHYCDKTCWHYSPMTKTRIDSLVKKRQSDARKR